MNGDIDKFGRSRALRPWKPVDEYIGLIFAECVSVVVRVVTVGVVIGVRRLGTGLIAMQLASGLEHPRYIFSCKVHKNMNHVSKVVDFQLETLMVRVGSVDDRFAQIFVENLTLS